MKLKSYLIWEKHWKLEIDAQTQKILINLRLNSFCKIRKIDANYRNTGRVYKPIKVDKKNPKLDNRMKFS